jgi:hypothetical protein
LIFLDVNNGMGLIKIFSGAKETVKVIQWDVDHIILADYSENNHFLPAVFFIIEA